MAPKRIHAEIDMAMYDDETPCKSLVGFVDSPQFKNFVNNAPTDLLVHIYFTCTADRVIKAKYDAALEDIRSINMDLHDAVYYAYHIVDNNARFDDNYNESCADIRRIDMMGRYYSVTIDGALRDRRAQNDRLVTYDDIIAKHAADIQRLCGRIDDEVLVNYS